MCGIAGVVAAASPERRDAVRRMCAALVHRGPDSDGSYDDDRVALGMRRLAIIDVAGGDQPVRDESGGIVAVVNGEIYNFRALHAELTARGHVLGSAADSACIPHLYEEYGLDFVSRLRGMFAIALWDRHRNRLVLARDRLGKKPLYYRVDPAGLAFASELKALLADPATDRRIDEAAISHYLTYQYVPAPYSALAAVRKLEPAHLLVYQGGRHTTSCYWRLEYHPDTQPDQIDEEECAEQLRQRLLDCVRVRLVSERPLGAFLSGGLDSSAVVAAMSRVSGERVRTFSIGFDEASHNELPYARQVADLYGTDHHELVVRPDAPEVLSQLSRCFDEPYADSSAIPSYYLAAMAGAQVTVALNGDGGDEALGGYLRYPRFLQGTAHRLPTVLARTFAVGGRALGAWGGRWPLARRAGTAASWFAESDPALRYARFVSSFRPEEKQALFTDELAARVAAVHSPGLVAAVWDRHRRTDAVNRLLAVDTHTYLPGDLLTKVDITTMAVSLEARSPLLDHTFVEWAAGLPGHLKVRGATTKYLFKRAMRPWLPERLISRRKMGFGIPLGDWLRGPLRPMVQDLLTDSTARSRGWFRPAVVARMLAEHQAGQDHGPHLYALLMLELWQREVIEAPLRVGV